MELPCADSSREIAERISQGEAQLDQLRFFDVVPEKLIIQISLRVESIQSLPPDKVPWEFGVLRYEGSTNDITLQVYASVAILHNSSSKLCAQTSTMGGLYSRTLTLSSRSSSDPSSVSALLWLRALFHIVITNTIIKYSLSEASINQTVFLWSTSTKYDKNNNFFHKNHPIKLPLYFYFDCQYDRNAKNSIYSTRVICQLTLITSIRKEIRKIIIYQLWFFYFFFKNPNPIQQKKLNTGLHYQFYDQKFLHSMAALVIKYNIMLKFNPANYLYFTPGPTQRLETSFLIANPSSNCSAPFKIKSTNPDLFLSQPHQGVLAPLQQVSITISTIPRASGDLSRQIATSHKFKVEYAMLERPPTDIKDALARIVEDNKQTHTYYISSSPNQTYRDDISEAKSSISQRLSYRSMRDDGEELKISIGGEDVYESLSEEQKLEYLREGIDKLEKQRSQAIMAKPKNRSLNILTLAIIIVIALIIGNLSGHMMGLPRKPTKAKKPKEYKYFGLQKLWASQQALPQEKSWFQWS